MPIHNWSSVEANVYHHFHQRWGMAICDALNGGLLPDHFMALFEQRASGLEPDVLALHTRTRPSHPVGGVLTSAPPKTKHVIQTTGPARSDRVVIRHQLGDVVCVIEIVSPANKTRHGLPSFVKKALELLENGVHLLVIDPFPPGREDPQGIHKAIWDAIDEQEFHLTADKPLILASYVAGDPTGGWVTRAYVEPIGFGDLLPDMPAYLTVADYVPVPLEATYQAAWASCPRGMRVLVETGHLPGDE